MKIRDLGYPYVLLLGSVGMMSIGLMVFGTGCIMWKYGIDNNCGEISFAISKAGLSIVAIGVMTSIVTLPVAVLYWLYSIVTMCFKKEVWHFFFK